MLLELLAELVLARSVFFWRFMELRLTSGKTGGISVHEASKVGNTVPFVSFSIISLAKPSVSTFASSAGQGTRMFSLRNSVSLVHILLIRLMYSIYKKKRWYYYSSHLSHIGNWNTVVWYLRAIPARVSPGCTLCSMWQLGWNLEGEEESFMLLPLVVLPYFLCDLADRTKLVRSSLASSLLSSKATDDATDEGDKDTKLKGSIYH